MNTKQDAGFFARRALAAAVTNLFVVAAFFLCAQTALRAQGVNATLTGTATDQSGALLPGVTVRITNPETGFQREVQSNDSGAFTFAALPPATYTVSANKDGFAPAAFNNLTLNVNDNRSLRIEMRIGDVGASVEVTDEPALIDESAAQATTIDRTFVGNLPLNGRSFQSLILLSPGVVFTQSNSEQNPGQFSVNGQRTNSNYFTVDGVSANVASNGGNPINPSIVGQTLSGSLPGLSALGTTNTLAPVDAVEQFTIQTSTYSAEYGRQPGAQVQILTRSGASEFHGSIYDYVRNEAFDANNFFNNARGVKRPPLRQNQFGGTFSGPVYLPRFGEGGPALASGKRTFFFFAYEGLRLRLPTTVDVFVPSLRLRQVAGAAFKPILNAFPVPTEPESIPGGSRFRATYSDPKSSDTYSLRVDHNLTDKLLLFGRYSDTPSADGSRFLNVITAARVRVRGLTLGTTFVGSSSFSNDLRFNYTQNRGNSTQTSDNFGGAVPIDASALYPGYTGPGPARGLIYLFSLGIGIGAGDSQDSYQRQINVVDTVSLIKGNHQFRFGLDYRRLMPTYAPFAFSQNTFVFTENEIRTDTALLTTVEARQGAEPRFNNYSFYGEDTWKATKRLTLNLGLRYELNPTPHDANGRQPITLTGINGVDISKVAIAPEGTPFYKTFKTALAPRLGAVYKLSEKPGRETVLRGGFGVFYDLAGGQAFQGYNNFPFRNSSAFFFQPFPLPPSLAQPPGFPAASLPLTSSVSTTDPNLKLPFTLEYNVGVERSLGKNQVLSVSYVGAAGRRLLSTLFLNGQLSRLEGAQFVPRRPNPNFNDIVYTTNGPTSDYNSLQAQFQRRLTNGFQALVNYTYSHAVDEVSNEVSPGNLVRGNADFDVRHNFTAALTYELPKFGNNRLVNAIAHGWAIDSIILAQSGQPIDISFGNQNLSDGTTFAVRPDYVEGQPLWIEAAGVPGGRRINPAAFVAPPRDADRNFLRQGNFGRNVVSGPGVFQVNTGLRREFGLYERLRLQLRAEAFNLFNRPQFSGYDRALTIGSPPVANTNFGIPNQTLNNSLGRSGGLNQLYQIGGPRSLQFSARFFF